MIWNGKEKDYFFCFPLCVKWCGYTLVMWWGGPVLQGLCWGEHFSLPLLFCTLLFWHIHHPPCERKAPLPWLTELGVSGHEARGEWRCFSGLKAVLVPWAYGMIVAGGNPALANVHLKSIAVTVCKHFRIIFLTIWGFYRLGLLSAKGSQSVSEGALEVKSEVHSSHFCLWITSLCCCLWQFWEPLVLRAYKHFILHNHQEVWYKGQTSFDRNIWRKFERVKTFSCQSIFIIKTVAVLKNECAASWYVLLRY